MPPYVLGVNGNGDLIEIDAASPGGNASAGFATNGKDLLATATGSKVIALAGFEIYGATSSNTALEPQSGQTLCFERPPSGLGLKPQWYYRYMPNMYGVALKNATGATIPHHSFVNIYETGDNVMKIRLADLSSGTDRPAHGIVITDVTATDPNNKTDHANVYAGSMLGGFVDTDGNGVLEPGKWYWQNPTTPGGITATKPTATGCKHQVVGYAMSRRELFICPMIPAEDLGATGGGGSGTAVTEYTAVNSTGSAINNNQLVNLYDVGGVTHIRLADVSGTNTQIAHGVAKTTIANGASGTVILFGIVTGAASGMTAGNPIYAHDATPGAITTNDPFSFSATQRQIIGIALSATDLFFYPRPLEQRPVTPPTPPPSVEVVATLPDTGLTNGRVVHDQSTNLTYKYDTSLTAPGWVSSVPQYREFDTAAPDSGVWESKEGLLTYFGISSLFESLVMRLQSDTVPDGSNYWLIEVVGKQSSAVFYSGTTDLMLYNTSWQTINEAPAFVASLSSNITYFIRLTPTGSPGTLNFIASLGWRAVYNV